LKVMRTMITLICGLALMAPATAGAAVHAAPGATGAHATYIVTALAPDSTVPAGFGGPATTFDATITPPSGAGCGSARTVKTIEDASQIAPGVRIHFALRAPKHGWCHGRYRVAVHEQIVETSAPDACASSSSTPCPAVTATQDTVLLRTSFKAR
jgi:hypothetical protein